MKKTLIILCIILLVTTLPFISIIAEIYTARTGKV